ncbi:MAG: cyanase [Actinomycetota bacterium]|jgi:cyanate lyase|nr:cyanase [Actinomycetota bacterium]
MNRCEVTELIVETKRRKGLTYAEIADKLGTDRVWTTAALLGQHPFDTDGARRVVELLELPEEVGAVLAEVPMRGSLDQVPPTDPTVYRLYEVLQVYGPALKALINEDFGDGIMSAIGFNLAVERVDADEGPRVKITLNGKFLPYSW